jgi:Protein of unknown function (DUF1161)
MPAAAFGRVGVPAVDPIVIKTTLFILTLFLANPAGAQSASCETLRADIEAKIRASGVAEFTVTVVDAASPAPGKLVGTCDRGAKKLVYLQRAAGSANAAASAAPAARQPAAVLTECNDGSVVVAGGGDCKKK